MKSLKKSLYYKRSELEDIATPLPEKALVNNTRAYKLFVSLTHVREMSLD